MLYVLHLFENNCGFFGQVLEFNTLGAFDNQSTCIEKQQKYKNKNKV